MGHVGGEAMRSRNLGLGQASGAEAAAVPPLQQGRRPTEGASAAPTRRRLRPASQGAGECEGRARPCVPTVAASVAVHAKKTGMLCVCGGSRVGCSCRRHVLWLRPLSAHVRREQGCP